MKHILIKGMGILSIVLLCCTLICGGWVATHPMNDMRFHAVFSAVSIGFAMITLLVYMMKCRFCSK